MIGVTGATGYLGSHIMCLLCGEGVAIVHIAPDKYAPSSTSELTCGVSPNVLTSAASFSSATAIIHCAAKVPQTDTEAQDTLAAEASVNMVRDVLRDKPRHLVFPSTRTGGGAYLEGKREAERLIQASGVPYTIIRFPGLFGRPKRHGLVYGIWRAALTGEPYTLERPATEWVGMHVEKAAQLCVQAARDPGSLPSLVIARDEELEAWLEWVKS